MATEANRGGVTLRALVVGTALCAFISVGPMYANCIIKGPFMAWAFSTPVALPTFGMVSHLLPMITNVFYFASPENHWSELLQPHVPRWIAPSDPEVIEGFYEGLLIKGQAILWKAWVEPLIYWTVFLLALYLVSVCLMVMVQQRVLWWPIHPPGLAISGTVFTTSVMWFNVFLAWLVVDYFTGMQGNLWQWMF